MRAYHEIIHHQQATMIELGWHVSHLIVALILTALVALVVRLQDGRQHDKQHSTNRKVAEALTPTRTDRSPTTNPIETSAPFDSLAVSYDKSFCETTVGCMLRRETWKVLEEAFASCSQVSPSSSDGNDNSIVIELSCGTGEDAMWLATKHVHILATDYSDGMIDVARSKCRSCSAIAKEDQPVFKRLDVKSFDTSSLDMGPTDHKFAGAYSNFGGLNNISPVEIEHCAQTLAQVLSPGAKVVLVVMGRFCLMETLYWLLVKRNIGKAFRRIKSSPTQGITVTVAKNKHTVYFHSMATVEAAFFNTRAFRRVKRRAIGLLVPPSLWSRSASRRIPLVLLSIFYSVDMLLGQLWPFIYMGDHYLIEFERL